MPKKLQKMTRFPKTRLMQHYVMVMCCYKFAPTPGYGDPCAARYHQTHAGFAQVRWKREGFISDHAARSKGKERRLICWVSKTALPIPIARMKVDAKSGVGDGRSAGACVDNGGSYQAVRLIQFRVEFWDRTR